MIRRNKLWLYVLPILLAAGCTTPTHKVKWVDTVDAAYSTDIPEERSSVVFYRPADAIEGAAVNIYVNGEYMGSLQPNAYRQETVCAQNQRFFAEFTNTDVAYYEKANFGDYYNLPESAVSFFKVVRGANGKPALLAVSPEQAETEMQGVKRQNHTLSRVVNRKSCGEYVLKKYTLQASALFKFDKSDYQDMLPKGKEEIAAISEDIKQNPNRISSIMVIGHTDPEGSEQYNNELSYRRAVTVKTALAGSGLNQASITPEGRGKRELVVANCRQLHPKNAQARQECDQPNRRVEIILHGQRGQ